MEALGPEFGSGSESGFGVSKKCAVRAITGRSEV